MTLVYILLMMVGDSSAGLVMFIDILLMITGESFA